MGILSKDDIEYLKKEFGKSLKNPVEIYVVVSDNCQYYNESKELIQEVASTNDKIKYKILDMNKYKDFLSKIKLPEGVDHGPLFLFKGPHGKINFGFIGLPAGHEFSAFIHDIISVSTNHLHISRETINKLSKIKKPVDIKVFVTPTCPYCPSAVYLAHQFAMVNENINAFMVEAMEFPKLADKYKVMAVPKNVINDKVEFEGAVPEQYFLEQLMLAVGL